MFRARKVVIAALATVLFPLAGFSQERISLTVWEGIERDALAFKSDGNVGAVLVHQMGANAASWTEFAERLQLHSIASVAVESIDPLDVRASVDFLESLGKERIVLIGASLGGTAVQAEVSNAEVSLVDLAILLGTAPGHMTDADEIDKLFIVSENDSHRWQSDMAFRSASHPKTKIVYPGSAHAQDMLTAPYGEELIKIIIAKIHE